MLLGFGLDARRFLGLHPPLALHLHAAVFTIWMFLLTVQVLLVVRDRVDIHRKLGWFLAAWACLMGVMGPVGLYTAVMMYVRKHGPGPDPFMCVQLLDISSFLVLLAIGISLRRNPAAHKRLMILSSVALASPGFSRFLGYVYPANPTTPFLLPRQRLLRQHSPHRLDARLGPLSRPSRPLSCHRVHLAFRLPVPQLLPLLLATVERSHLPVDHRLGKVGPILAP